jgi:DNA-binding response OmpR family regulator
MDSPDHPLLRVCLICQDEAVTAAVQASLPLPHRLTVFSPEGLVDAHSQLSAYGSTIIEAAEDADVVLIQWDLKKAPIINTVCYHIRRRMLAPVLILCRGYPDELVAAVAAGGDDAVTFPLFPAQLGAKALSYRRLVAAVQATPRAALEPAEGGGPPHLVQSFGTLQLDHSAHRLYANNTPISLTPREFALLAYLIAQAGRLCTRDQILNHVWGLDFDTGTNMVDVYMYFLRKKLVAHGLASMIQTVRGHGYRLVEPDTQARDPGAVAP